jgi:hypothetical protein
MTALPNRPALQAFRHTSAVAHDLIEALDATCYGNGNFNDDQRRNMVEALKRFSQTQKHPPKTNAPLLPPLYSD